MRPGSVISLLCVLLLSAACKAPTQFDDYVSYADRDPLGRYRFELDMTDSLSLYDVDFYTSIQGDWKTFRKMGNMCLNVRMISPSGVMYEETVPYPKDSFQSSSAFSRQYYFSYRTGLSPKEHGVWKVFAKLPETPGVKLWGMGMKVQKHPQTD